MLASGVHPEKGLVEIVEVKNHPWFVGVQFHPEYKSTVDCPHTRFVSFVKAAFDYLVGTSIEKKAQKHGAAEAV